MEILQARILECVAMPFSRGSSQPRDRTQVSSTAGRFFTIWVTREARILEQIVISYSKRYADDTTIMAKSEELKSLLMKVKVESEKVGLKLTIQKMKIMASGPITSWQIGGEIVETVTDFISGGSKITADGDCSHEIKRCLLLGRKVMINLDSI